MVIHESGSRIGSPRSPRSPKRENSYEILKRNSIDYETGEKEHKELRLSIEKTKDSALVNLKRHNVKIPGEWKETAIKYRILR